MTQFLVLIASIFWIGAPVIVAGVLHMLVVRWNLFRRLARPIDGGRCWRGRRLLGDNKTWRGLLVMPAAAAILGGTQGLLGGTWSFEAGLSPLSGTELMQRFGIPSQTAALGLLFAACGGAFGFAYVAGELPNSWLKRRLGIGPGETRRDALGSVFLWIDQADSVVAVLLVALFAFTLEWSTCVLAAVLLTLVHLAVNASLRFMRVKARF